MKNAVRILKNVDEQSPPTSSSTVNCTQKCSVIRKISKKIDTAATNLYIAITRNKPFRVMVLSIILYFNFRCDTLQEKSINETKRDEKLTFYNFKTCLKYLCFLKIKTLFTIYPTQ